MQAATSLQPSTCAAPASRQPVRHPGDVRKCSQQAAPAQLALHTAQGSWCSATAACSMCCTQRQMQVLPPPTDCSAAPSSLSPASRVQCTRSETCSLPGTQQPALLTAACFARSSRKAAMICSSMIWRVRCTNSSSALCPAVCRQGLNRRQAHSMGRAHQPAGMPPREVGAVPEQSQPVESGSLRTRPQRSENPHKGV